eukprot:TRINITY_DN3850_c0_g1_i3.p2 TRINITY_DN3850_c0_g1~~TRINITY_DN3850_c0_g1_i3.p2  ORF type:complete len:107 (+),score=12.13 TRINITY_DN3850_c0_g1_i3:188-508(+)
MDHSASKVLGAAAVVGAAAAGTAFVMCSNGSDSSRRIQGRAIEELAAPEHGAVYDLCLYQYERWLPIVQWRSQNLHFYERSPLSDLHGQGTYELDAGAPAVELPDG